MKRNVVATWLLVGLMVVLAPMAWASPVDPSWIKGWYDDADFDDVITFLTSGTVAIPALPIAELLPILASVPAESALDERLGASTPVSSYSPRAPPLS
ncbi:MAG TPA: hypothetical protein VJX92_26385 [Methylomirabilota bacterium]|nr:hypothetical protein [Methylomirabilota bacterium]